MSLYALVYISLATHKMTEAELSSLLATCRQNNRLLEVTGLLLYRDGFFIQALEGQKSALDTLFEKISRDTRHSDVLLIYREPIAERAFGEWSMGFKTFDQTLLNTLDGFSDFLSHPTPDFFAQDPGKAKTLLYTFRTRHPLSNLGPSSMDASGLVGGLYPQAV
ncbi:MAG: BLUF domain-containing protein [Methylococcaceae bacterium]